MKNLNLVNVLSSDAVPGWVVSSFPIIKIILAVLICLSALLVTIFVLCQKTEDQGGTNAITGTADTFYNRNKGESLQGKIKKATIVLTITIFVLCIAFLIINSIYRGY